jgi:integrase/recombinase XerD
MDIISMPAAAGDPQPSTSLDPVSQPDVATLVRLATAAYLARYKGDSRAHTCSDLGYFEVWCRERGFDLLSMQRTQLELYVRWMQETRRYRPSTVSRRVSVLCGFYRTCVIDGILEHSPAEYLRRPTVPPESPTLGLSHLQFEAMLTAARTSINPFDFALVTMLGLLGRRIFEATGLDVSDLREEHGHRVLRAVGKGTKIVLVPLPPAVGRAVDRAIAERTSGPILRNTRGRRMDRHAATRRLLRLAEVAGVRLPRMHPHMLRHTFVTTMQVGGIASDASFDVMCDRCAATALDFRDSIRSMTRAANRPGRRPVKVRCCNRHNNRSTDVVATSATMMRPTKGSQIDVPASLDDARTRWTRKSARKTRGHKAVSSPDSRPARAP